MTAGELKRLVKTGENGEVEFKRGRGGVPGDFWPSYSAFANTDGGVIVLGVSEKNGVRMIEGVENAEKVRADLWNAANNPDKVSDNVLLNKRVYPLEVDGKTLVVAEVPRADRRVKPVYVGSDVFKGTYRRNGEGDYHCSREAVEAMIRDKRRSGMGLSNLYSTWAELGYDRPDLEEFHEPDQTVLKVYLKTSTKSVKTSTKKTSSKSEKTREKKTRGKKCADAAEPLQNKGETPKTVGKRTVGKSAKTVGKKTVGKSAKTRGKDWGLKDEDLVVLRLTSNRVVVAMRENPKITREELATQLNVTLRGIEWQVAKLQKDKVIRRVGGRKFGSWEVLI